MHPCLLTNAYSFIVCEYWRAFSARDLIGRDDSDDESITILLSLLQNYMRSPPTFDSPHPYLSNSVEVTRVHQIKASVDIESLHLDLLHRYQGLILLDLL